MKGRGHRDPRHVRRTHRSAARLLRLRRPRPLHLFVRQRVLTPRCLGGPHDLAESLVDCRIGRECLRDLRLEEDKVYARTIALEVLTSDAPLKGGEVVLRPEIRIGDRLTGFAHRTCAREEWPASR